MKVNRPDAQNTGFWVYVLHVLYKTGKTKWVLMRVIITLMSKRKHFQGDNKSQKMGEFKTTPSRWMWAACKCRLLSEQIRRRVRPEEEEYWSPRQWKDLRGRHESDRGGKEENNDNGWVKRDGFRCTKGIKWIMAQPTDTAVYHRAVSRNHPPTLSAPTIQRGHGWWWLLIGRWVSWPY